MDKEGMKNRRARVEEKLRCEEMDIKGNRRKMKKRKEKKKEEE